MVSNPTLSANPTQFLSRSVGVEGGFSGAAIASGSA
jgi:hypothetical protein